MLYKIIEMEQGSQEWLKWRQTKIGASDASAILGVSPWDSPYDLWQEKLGFKPPKQKNSAMKRGTELEPIARMKAEEILGICLDPVVVESSVYPWMIASLDGISEDNETMIEIKCPGEKDHEEAKSGTIPQKYIPQLQHQLAITGLEKMRYFSYSPHSWSLLEVKRDLEYIDRLIEAEKAFYDCLMHRIPPDCRETRIIEMEDEEWEKHTQWYYECKQKKEWYENEMEYTKLKLIELSGGLEAQGMGFKLSKVVKKGNVNWDAVCKTYQISESECDNFRKSNTEYWTIKKGE